MYSRSPNLSSISEDLSLDVMSKRYSGRLRWVISSICLKNSSLLFTSSMSMAYLDRRPSLEYTTSNAAFFSDTINTVLPSLAKSAMMLVMVWDFPVPGGPCMTSLSVLLMADMTSSWAELRSLMYVSSLSFMDPPLTVSFISPLPDTRRSSKRGFTICPSTILSKSFWMELEYVGNLPITALPVRYISPMGYTGNWSARYPSNLESSGILSFLRIFMPISE